MASLESGLAPNLESNVEPVASLSSFGSIGTSMRVVEQLRAQYRATPALQQAVAQLKRWQSQRFHDTYADILAQPDTGPAARFFLTELYSERDFSQRDEQFARIAGAIERLFPKAVVHTASLLAQLHALSETLDARMAQQWLAQQDALQDAQQDAGKRLTLKRYQQLWQALQAAQGYNEARSEQIDTACQLGRQLQSHTRVPGLRLMLKMMRGPAAAAGLLQLQVFLEAGFDTFAQLGRSGRVDEFLSHIETRERAWLAKMAEPPTSPE
jgi:hypothetical protein